jgi:hypothetical protein
LIFHKLISFRFFGLLWPRNRSGSFLAVHQSLQEISD